MIRESKLKLFLQQQKDEITKELLENQDKLDDISKEHLKARYQAFEDVEKMCEQRGRY